MNWQIYTDTNEAISAVEKSCQLAQRSIDIEMFIFTPELARGTFGKVLLDKSRGGLDVRLILDMVGSFDLIGSAEYYSFLEAGIKVTIFNPISLWRLHNFTSWYFRNHRKILVVDGRIAYTGGVNLNRARAERRDTQVRVEGSLAREAKRAFDLMWINTKSGKWRPFGLGSVVGDSRFLTHSPHRRERYLLRECIKAITRAKESINIITPYFVPSLRFTSHLRAAAKRGVVIRILLPSLSDHTLADLAGRSYIGLMLSAGIRIFVYKPQFLHAKVVTVDDDWSMVGSLNIDNLSFLYNYEAGLVSTDRSFNLELREQFAKDLTHSSEIKKNEWHKRPLSDKVLEAL